MKYRQSPYKTLLLLSILVLYLGSCSNDEILLPDVKPIQGTTPTPDPNPDPVMSMMIPLEELRNELTEDILNFNNLNGCLLYTSPSPRDRQKSRMPSSA